MHSQRLPLRTRLWRDIKILPRRIKGRPYLRFRHHNFWSGSWQIGVEWQSFLYPQLMEFRLHLMHISISLVIPFTSKTWPNYSWDGGWYPDGNAPMPVNYYANEEDEE